MRSRHEAMTWEEFRRMPMHPAWNYDYFGGEVHVTPKRDAIALLRLPVAERPPVPAPVGVCLRAVDPEQDRAALVDAFFHGFRNTIEYCDWNDERIRGSAFDCITTSLGGRRGPFLPRLSRVAVSEDAPERIAAAALLVRSEDGLAHIDLLFVRPEWHRTGLATAMGTEIVNALQDAGEFLLSSAYHVGNAASVAWHTRFGFVEEPDLGIARDRLRCARHEIARRELLGELSDAESAALLAECQRLAEVVADLTAVEGRDGYESVRPAHSRRQRRAGIHPGR